MTLGSSACSALVTSGLGCWRRLLVAAAVIGLALPAACGRGSPNAGVARLGTTKLWGGGGKRWPVGCCPGSLS